MLGDLREAESGFRKRTWMWVITVQFSLFNFGVWAPFLVLGPSSHSAISAEPARHRGRPADRVDPRWCSRCLTCAA